MTAGQDPVEEKPTTCYDCIHHGVCKYNAAELDRRFPFKNDDAIRKYLEAITTAQAAACAFFTMRKDDKK